MIGDAVTKIDGATAPPLTIGGGTVWNASAMDVLRVDGGILYQEEDTVAAELHVAGTVYYQSTGTAAEVHIYGGGTVDCTKDLRDRIFTETHMYAGASFKDPHNTVTHTADIDLHGCGLSDVNIDWGKHFTVARTAI